MAHLDIAFLTGDVERHELSKQQPVSIGSHNSNDICIDEDGVEMMHCRIAWNKTGFEAVSAGVDGIDINGSLVQRAMLTAGDILRFGSVDVTFQGEGAPAEGAAAPDSEVGLKPITDEVPAAGKKVLTAPPAEDSDASKKKKDEGSSSRRKRPAPPVEETTCSRTTGMMPRGSMPWPPRAASTHPRAARCRVGKVNSPPARTSNNPTAQKMSKSRNPNRKSH
jgi:FHA domain